MPGWHCRGSVGCHRAPRPASLMIASCRPCPGLLEGALHCSLLTRPAFGDARLGSSLRSQPR